MRKKVRILLTSVGGLAVPKLIDDLRAVPELDPTFVGVDASREAVGAFFVDEFFQVPYGTDPEYADALLDVCKRKEIDLVIPLSDEETISLSRDAGRFAALRTAVLCSPYETTDTASNKFRFLSRLRERGVPTPRFYMPRSRQEVDGALRELGYPAKDVVFKPLDGHGSRGFRLLSARFDELDHILTSKKETLLSLPRLLSLLERRQEFPAFLLMEYLEGDNFSVDVLVQAGRCKYIIPQRKLAPRHGSLEVGLVERDGAIERSVERIVGAFDFDYLINIDMAYRGHPRKGEVLPFDLNARPSAVISSTAGAGCFLLAEAIFQALGVERPRKEYHPVRMIRHWNEKYICPR